MAQRIGIYPGTFDPIHIGHIAFSEKTLELCHLDRVILLPETHPREKPDVSPLMVRLSQIEKMLTYTGNPALEIYTPNSSPFTITKTLPEIYDKFGQDELTLLLGSDVIKKSFIDWHNLEVLLLNVTVSIGMRQNDTLAEIQAVIRHIEKRYAVPLRHTIVQTAYPDVASTSLRDSSQLTA